MIVRVARIGERGCGVETVTGFDAHDAHSAARVDLEDARERDLPAVRNGSVDHAGVVREHGVACSREHDDPPLRLGEKADERGGQPRVRAERGIEIRPGLADEVEHVAGEDDHPGPAELLDGPGNRPARLARRVGATRDHADVGEDDDPPTTRHGDDDLVGDHAAAGCQVDRPAGVGPAGCGPRS